MSDLGNHHGDIAIPEHRFHPARLLVTNSSQAQPLWLDLDPTTNESNSQDELNVANSTVCYRKIVPIPSAST